MSSEIYYYDGDKGLPYQLEVTANRFMATFAFKGVSRSETVSITPDTCRSMVAVIRTGHSIITDFATSSDVVIDLRIPTARDLISLGYRIGGYYDFVNIPIADGMRLANQLALEVDGDEAGIPVFGL